MKVGQNIISESFAILQNNIPKQFANISKQFLGFKLRTTVFLNLFFFDDFTLVLETLLNSFFGIIHQQI